MRVIFHSWKAYVHIGFVRGGHRRKPRQIIETSGAFELYRSRRALSIRGGIVFISEEKIEIRGETPPAMAKKVSKSGIGDIAVNLLGVEVIGKIKTAHGDPYRVFGVYLEIFGKPGINREEVGEPGAVGDTDVALRSIGLDVREAAAILDHRGDLELKRQANHAPPEEAVGEVCAECAVLILAD